MLEGCLWNYALLYYIVKMLFVEIYFTVLLYCLRAVCGNIPYCISVLLEGCLWRLVGGEDNGVAASEESAVQGHHWPEM